MKAKKYVTKAHYIEAIQWKGDNYGDISDFIEEKCYLLNRCLFVEMSSCTVPINIGDYVCKSEEYFGGINVLSEKQFINQFEEVK